MRTVSPPGAQIGQLRTPLTPGEKRVFHFFDANLPKEWEIYVQPHLNGLRPDFVLLNPKVGIAVYEVKDWDLDAINYRIEARQMKSPKLLGTNRDGKTFSLQSENPVERVHRYKQEVYELYCPRLKERSGFSAITAGVIFPFACQDRIEDLFRPSYQFWGMDKNPRYYPLVDSDDLDAGQLEKIFPEAMRSSSKQMDPELAKDFRNWLIEPSFSADQREPLQLDANQRALVTTRTESGYRRLKGPAGSGKSIVLAARASQLMTEGKKVLVITYNITLIHYLMDMAVRWPHEGYNTREDITWLNFHTWCKRVCEDADHAEEYKGIWRRHFDTEEEFLETKIGDSPSLTDLLAKDLPGLVTSLLESPDSAYVEKYDAILVDEGQDIIPSWWNALRKACKPGGEMLLVADATQDIYSNARSWTDQAMIGAGFPGGKWATLSVSYRMPPAATERASSFAERYLPKDLLDTPRNPQGELDLFPCKMRWVQTTRENAAQDSVAAILDMPIFADPDILSIPDVTFLSPSNDIGLQVVKMLGNKGIRVVHTFSQNGRDSRRLKHGFFMGAAKVKATTLHSFKGWETRALVVYTGYHLTQRSRALIYSGLTRIKRHPDGSYITVVSAIPELAGYGSTWPDQK